MKATKQSVDNFLSTKKVAIAGVSRNPKKFGYQVYKHLLEHGFEVFPINPNTDQIDGATCFRSVSALPLSVHNLLVLTKKKQTFEVMKEALGKGIDNIWIQPHSDTREAVDAVKGRPVNLITGECIFMHTEPVTSIHKFHRTVRGFFGQNPR